MPGRVNLIGEHIDYHNLAVLPIAIQRHLTVDFQSSGDERVIAHSAGYGERTLRLSGPIVPSTRGDWENYLKAAVNAVRQKWPVQRGFSAAITSDLPSAAGLSSSSALLTAFTLGLLHANGIQTTPTELMSILPEAEHFVGTRGGGMDHAAVLASRAGFASWLSFAPFGIEHVPVPPDWRLLLAHSLTRAEKSGAARARYNACRTAGTSALRKTGFTTYREALQAVSIPDLTPEEDRAFRHVVTEANRVTAAAGYLRDANRSAFGALLLESHASLRDRLAVSCPALDRIVEIACDAGADGARLTGAGFGGCAIILCSPGNSENVFMRLEQGFYSAHPEYRRGEHLFEVQPANGALHAGIN